MYEWRTGVPPVEAVAVTPSTKSRQAEAWRRI